MQVIVTIQQASEARAYDVEVPTTMAFGEIAAIVAEKLGWGLDSAGAPLPYEIEAVALGRRLRPDETPARSEVWDGAWLIFHAVAQAIPAPAARRLVPPQSPAQPQLPSAPHTGPVTQWRPLDLASAPPAGAFTDPATPPPRGVPWRRIDADE